MTSFLFLPLTEEIQVFCRSRGKALGRGKREFGGRDKDEDMASESFITYHRETLRYRIRTRDTGQSNTARLIRRLRIDRKVVEQQSCYS